MRTRTKMLNQQDDTGPILSTEGDEKENDDDEGYFLSLERMEKLNRLEQIIKDK